MKKVLSLIMIIVIIVATLASCGFLGGNSGNNDGNTGDSGNQGQSKRVPIYQGMTIGSVNESASLSTLPNLWAGTNNGNGNNGDNGNHYGQYKGDHVGKDEAVDEENPYPDNSENENIETEIESSLKVEGAVHDIYYATPNEDIYIYIHINNPDNFEIVSFTLNGKKYASYMFEGGSDMETIILKYNVGGSSGIVEYTIDAIKYIDGTEIKDVIIDGDKTVRAGIRTGNQVAASIGNLSIGTNSMSFNADIKDNDGLIAFVNGTIKAVIYDGESIIAEKDLTLGENSVSFEGLKTNTLYQYAVVGYYDDLSGGGFGMYVLHKDAFCTDAVVLFSDISVWKDGIDFGLLWHESCATKQLTSLKLYQNDRLVKELSPDATSIRELLSANTYTLIAEYSNNGVTESITLEFTTFEKGVPVINLNKNSITQSSISFIITEEDEESVGNITKIELIHKNGTTVAENTDVREFTDLLSDNEYTVRVTYTYNLNDGSGEQVVTRELLMKTHAKSAPIISIINPGSTQESINFEVEENDADNVGTITKVELAHKDGTIVAENVDVREFTNLLSNNTYTIRITYTYNLNDGNGDQVITEDMMVTTLAKAEPDVNIDNINSTTDSIKGDFIITDDDGTLVNYRIDLYKGNTIVSADVEKIDFTSLTYYTDYTIKITYTYDLNDGKGEQTKTIEKSVTTLPYIDVTGCNIANTSAVSEGDTIFMQVTLDNPLNMAIESVVINGKTYNVTGASTSKKIFVEIVYNGQFAGGDTYLKIDKVNAKIDNTSLVAIPKSELSDNVFINGKLEFISVEYVNDNFEPIDYLVGSREEGFTINYNIIVRFDNPTGYNIDFIESSGSPSSGSGQNKLTKIDDNTWYYSLVWYYKSESELSFSINKVSYSNEYISKTIDLGSDVTDRCIVCTEKVTISTPDDLKHCFNYYDYYYYELTNDIDLSGIEWQGAEFKGVLDGNGYSIKNMSFVGTISNQVPYLGLFTEATGVIQNLHIKNATIIADVVSNDNNEYMVYCGGFAAYTKLLTMVNCTIDEYSIFSVKNSSFDHDADSYIGGFVGFIDNGTVIFNICSNYATISIQGNETMAGGLFGSAFGSIINITDCYNSGDISSDFYAGGLYGDSAHGGSVYVSRCFNSGKISSLQGSGGIAGSSWYNIVKIYDCLNIGNIVPAEGSTFNDHNGILGCNVTKVNISNCYSLNSYLEELDGSLCTIDQLNSKSFYTDVLGWSEDVWDLSELDIENGKYPKLK